MKLNASIVVEFQREGIHRYPEAGTTQSWRTFVLGVPASAHLPLQGAD
jgi:hypothetical protein